MTASVLVLCTFLILNGVEDCDVECVLCLVKQQYSTINSLRIKPLGKLCGL